MKIYNYDKQTGEYIGESTASENPLEIGEYLIPANATTEAPIVSQEGFVTVFKDGEWTSVDDIRGTWYNIREEVVITSLDDDVSRLTKEPIAYTDEELQAKAIQEWKASRTLAVANIKVTVDDMEFDGDEASQTRMTRAITAMDDTETISWVLADNTSVAVTKATLVKALKLAGEAQTALWIYS